MVPPNNKDKIKGVIPKLLVEEGYNREAHKPYVGIFLRMTVTSFSGRSTADGMAIDLSIT